MYTKPSPPLSISLCKVSTAERRGEKRQQGGIQSQFQKGGGRGRCPKFLFFSLCRGGGVRQGGGRLGQDKCPPFPDFWTEKFPFFLFPPPLPSFLIHDRENAHTQYASSPLLYFLLLIFATFQIILRPFPASTDGEYESLGGSDDDESAFIYFPKI